MTAESLSAQLAELGREAAGSGNRELVLAAVALLHCAASLLLPEDPDLWRLAEYSALAAGNSVQFYTGDGEAKN